jgi:hypothetical protein
LTPGKTYNILIQKEYTDPYTVPVSTATIPEGPQVTGYTVAELPDNPTIVDIFDVAEGNVRVQYEISFNNFFDTANIVIGDVTIYHANVTNGKSEGNVYNSGLTSGGSYTFPINVNYDVG